MSNYTQPEVEAIVFRAMEANGGKPTRVLAMASKPGVWRIEADTALKSGTRYSALTDDELSDLDHGSSPSGTTSAASGGAV